MFQFHESEDPNEDSIEAKNRHEFDRQIIFWDHRIMQVGSRGHVTA